LVLDGGMGSLLEARGVSGASERANLTHPELVGELQAAYYAAGSDVVSANTFGINPLRYSKEDCLAMLEAAFAIIRSVRPEGKYIALDLGPTGKLLRPYGDLSFEEAYESFRFVVQAAKEYRPDVILVETMNDSYETKAAVLAAKESGLPVFATNVYDASAKLMTGADIPAMVAMLEGLRVDALGLNCSLGPEQMLSLVPTFLKYSSLPVIIKPNAGLPREEKGRTVYDVSAEEFAAHLAEAVKLGASIVGGCCGTTPEYIARTVEKTRELPFLSVTKKGLTLVSSYTHAVEIGPVPLLIGERINPTGKKKLKAALRESDWDYILGEATSQADRGAHVLDVNVGLPELNEPEVLVRVVEQVQAVTDLPLQIDTVHPEAMERALRVYNGKALVNSVDGKQESMDAVFPLVAKYGGTVICLTMDESGIPPTAEGRLAIAKRILREAEKYGIGMNDLVFDPLTLTVSSDPDAGKVTLDSLSLIGEMGGKTSLGVSNISFGLPNRDFLNAAFFTLALEHGLKCAIMNPFSEEMIKAYRTFLALKGLDRNFEDYIAYADSHTAVISATGTATKETKEEDSLEKAIGKGLKEAAAKATRALLASEEPLSVIERHIVPALNAVGEGFEQKKVYLPQLLMSADAAKEAFAVIKDAMPSAQAAGPKIVLATVKGDIHDIGKNIVRVLLENFGFTVIDLGKDVAPERIVAETVSLHVQLVGLSALMTTTVPYMEETIRLLRESAPWTKVVVGGAVLTQEYADRIGADCYAKDAMETVRYAEKVFDH
ncbi:MAG: homocysteine S-methyltransferase family protein, partial [Christensenellaceae bacterium]